MNLSLLLQHKAVLVIRHLVRTSDCFDVAPEATRSGKSPVMAQRFAHDGIPVFSSAALASCNRSQAVARSKPAEKPSRRPLRVSQVVEKIDGRASAGRMVISGSMADVCAELDRLVAREAALH